MIDQFEVTNTERITLFESLIAEEDQNEQEHFDWTASKQDPF